MEALSKISLPQEPVNDSNRMLSRSRVLLDEGTGSALTVLMAETIARYPNQEITELTQDMYLTQWEEMVSRYGLQEFEAALSRVIRDLGRKPFFPDPSELDAECRASRRARSERDAAQAALLEGNLMKAQWERERLKTSLTGL